MTLFIPITKVDVAKRLVYGTISEEVPDKSGEILDYESAKPEFQKWSEDFHKASGGKSLGNVRAMHGAVAAGKLTDIEFDDDNRRISGVAKIVDDDEWEKVLEGVYTGFSIGGGYARRWPDMANPQLMRYTPTLAEVSIVDNPAVPTATFEVVKQDGSVECRKFNPMHEEIQMNKTTRMTDNSESDASQAATLLEQLAWLKDELEEEGDEEMLAHLEALEEYLTGEEGEDEPEDYEDDDDTSSHSYATELARMEHRFGLRKRQSENVMESFSRQVAELQKRIARLEAMPLPPKGVLRAIGKGDDHMSAAEELAKLNPADRARELMKIALANPVGM